MDPKELKAALVSARYAALSRACTEQAKQLVDHIFMQLARTDGPKQSRGLYVKSKQQMRRGVEGLLGDLLRAVGHEKAKGFVYRSMQAKSFTGEDVRYRAFREVVDQLKALGLVDHFVGYQQWGEGFGGPKVVHRGKASRFKARPQLLELAARFGVPVNEAKAHFIIQLPKHPLELRGSSSRNEYGQKIKGRPIRFKPTPKTDKLEAEVRELNEFFDNFELRGGTHRGYNRIFSGGDNDDFNWNMGGRLYSQGEDSYQRMKEEDRLRMTIDGEPVCEIDIRASYLTIYLAWFKQELDWSRDPYDLPDVSRDIAKQWFVATFGNKKHLQRWPTGASSDYREQSGSELGKDFPLKVVKQKAIGKFPVLKNWGQQKGSWPELMYCESVAVVSAMLRLKREHQVPSLSVHDSLIVPVSKREVAEKLLVEEYFRVNRARPKLETSLPEGS